VLKFTIHRLNLLFEESHLLNQYKSAIGLQDCPTDVSPGCGWALLWAIWKAPAHPAAPTLSFFFFFYL
jgi:hypothetical protein